MRLNVLTRHCLVGAGAGDNLDVAKLLASNKRLCSVTRRQDAMISFLNKLSLAQESKILSYQADSAEDIAAEFISISAMANIEFHFLVYPPLHCSRCSYFNIDHGQY